MSGHRGRRAGTPILGRRERAIINLVAEGRTIREIAEQFGVSYFTVHNQMATIREKLDAPCKTIAVLRAYELGLLG